MCVLKLTVFITGCFVTSIGYLVLASFRIKMLED